MKILNTLPINDKFSMPGEFDEQFKDEMAFAAIETLKRIYPDREIVPIYTREVLLGGGNIRCIT